jgi:hypothetical protein
MPVKVLCSLGNCATGPKTGLPESGSTWAVLGQGPARKSSGCGRNSFRQCSTSSPHFCEWINPAALIQAMVVNVYEILGRLTDLPDDLKRDLYK